MGEPEDLSGCSRTVFGAKILCGLISPINPQSSQEDRGFFVSFTAEDAPCIRARTHKRWAQAESAEKTLKVRSDEFDTDKKEDMIQKRRV
jgi:hypothetical protein